MALFIPVPNCAEMSLQYIQGTGDFAENTWGVQRDEAWDVASLNAMAEAFMTWWKTGAGGTAKYQHYQSDALTMSGCGARDLTTESSLSIIKANDTGTLTGGSAAPQVNAGLSFSITARTSLAGRSFRGRTFLAGLTDDFIDDTSPNRALVAAANEMVSALNALIVAVHAADVHSNLCVISRRHANLPRVTGVTTPIVSYSYHDLFIDFQRRRAPAHNRHH